MSCFVYVLKLIKNKYYIGKSMEPFTRINNHFKGLGSKWTKKYKPVEVMKVINECDQFDEDKYTKMYMAKYGIDNVRGGSYCGLFIDANTRKYINKEIATAFDKCFICGGYYHMANMCPDKYNSFSAPTPDTNSKYEPDLDPIIELPIEEEYYKRCEEFEEAIKGNDFDISTLTNGQLYMIDTEGNISIKPKDDFASWRDWRVSDAEKKHLNNHVPFVNDMAVFQQLGASGFNQTEAEATMDNWLQERDAQP